MNLKIYTMYVHQGTTILTFLHNWCLPDRFLKYRQQKNFSIKLGMGTKMQNLMLSLNPLKKSPKKVRGHKTFAHSNKSQKLNFSLFHC